MGTMKVETGTTKYPPLLLAENGNAETACHTSSRVAATTKRGEEDREENYSVDGLRSDSHRKYLPKAAVSSRGE